MEGRMIASVLSYPESKSLWWIDILTQYLSDIFYVSKNAKFQNVRKCLC